MQPSPNQNGRTIRLLLLIAKWLPVTLPALLLLAACSGHSTAPVPTPEDSAKVLFELVGKAQDINVRYNLESSQAEDASRKGTLTQTLPQRWIAIDSARLDALDNLYSIYKPRLSDVPAGKGTVNLPIRTVLDGYYALRSRRPDGSTDWILTLRQRDQYAKGLPADGKYIVWSIGLPTLASGEDCELILSERPEGLVPCAHFLTKP